MKQRITSYTFMPAAKQIVFPNLFNLALDGFLLITDLATNAMIFNFATPGLSGTLSGNVLTLNYDTSSMAVNDALQIWYDDGQPAKDLTSDVLDRIATSNEQIRDAVIVLINLNDPDGSFSVDDLTGDIT